MPKMRAAQVVSAKGPYQIVEREISEPGAGQVRIRVQASGVCHSDSLTKEGIWPGLQYPRVPGHEVAGIVDAVGTDVAGWSVGDRVGGGTAPVGCTDGRSPRAGSTRPMEVRTPAERTPTSANIGPSELQL